MKKYFNKALLYKEYKNAKWFVLGFTLIMFIDKIMIFNDISRSIEELSRNKNLDLESIKTTCHSQVLYSGYKLVFSLFFVALGAFLIFGLDNKNYKKLLSMPFKKKDIAINKIFVAILSVVIPYTVIYLMLLIIRAISYASSQAYLSYGDITTWYLFQIFIAMFNMLFIGLMLTLCGNNIFALVVSGIFIIYPSFFFDATKTIYRLIFRISLAAQGLGNNVLNNVYSNNEFFEDTSFYTLGKYFSPSLYEEQLGQWESVNLICIGILIVLSIILIGLIIVSYNKISYEERRKLIPFKGLERFFSFGVSLSFAMLAILIFVNPGTIIINAYNYGYIILKSSVIFFGLIIAGYFINNKILKNFCQ